MQLTNRTIAVVGALGALLLFFAPVAQAAPATTFAETGSRAGQIKVSEGIAANHASGDVYIADDGNSRIARFDSDGNFLMAWGVGVADPDSATLQTCGPLAAPTNLRCFEGVPFGPSNELAMSPRSVAVDQASGDVYVAERLPRRVYKFTFDGQFVLMFGKGVNTTPGTPTPNLCTAADLEAGGTCGGGEAGSGAGEFFASPKTVVVDSEGRVWVDDGTRLVQFESSGNHVSEADLPGELGEVSGLQGNAFARDSGGDFLAIAAGNSEEQEVTFKGFAKGDTYRLGNLPPGCSSPSTDPIGYPADIDGDVVKEALEGKCGSGSILTIGFEFGTVIPITWRGKFTDQNIGQLTCEPVTGSGTCSVSTEREGKAGKVIRLESSGSPVTTLIPQETVYTGAPYAVAVDATDNVYVGDAVAPYRFKIFNPVGEQVSQFGAGQVIGLPGSGGKNAIAVGESAKALYSVSSIGLSDDHVAQRFTLPERGPLPGNERGEDLLPTTATLAATLNPEGHATTYFFEYGTDQNYGKSTSVESLGGSGYEDEDVAAALDHLIPDTTYHFRLVATNHCNDAEPAEECTVEGEDTTFRTPPAVEVESQWATDVTDTTATFRAELDPLGAPAVWWLEYGTDMTYGSTTAEKVLGSGFGAVAVQAPIANLQPGTTYHYRFAARDERDGVVYTVHGNDRTTTTQLGGLGLDLADRRVWEMVSPPQKFGAKLVGGITTQAAEDGGEIAYFARGSIEADPEGNRLLEPSTILARRVSQSWHSKDITPPNERVVPVSSGNPGEYALFAPDFSRAILDPHTVAPLSPLASERTPYLRENVEPPIYTPLVHPGNVDTEPKFGGSGPDSAVRIAGATPDLSHVALSSTVSLLENVPDLALYLWDAGQLEPIGVLPAGEGGGFVEGGVIGSGEASVQRAISEDGARIFWSTGTYDPSGNNLTGLYLRDMEAGQTARLDVAQPGATGFGSPRPVFQGASADGTVVFFTDSRELTEDASPGGRDLYRCEIPPGTLPPGCATMTDISSPGLGSSDSAEVLGVSPGVSEDGSMIYFVAEGVLDAGAVPGEPNLYVWVEGEGVRFIAALDPADDAAWGLGGTANVPGATSLNAAGSPSGHYLAFMSQRGLTGYDNRDAASGAPLQEVFLYDAIADQLRCVSCNPSGGRPSGVEPLDAGLVDPRGRWTGEMLAGVLPLSNIRGTAGYAFYQPRAVLENGRVFFNAFDALVPADANGGWDVYQHEPTGVGDCTTSSGDADTARSAGGCVSLISSGTAEEEVGFLDASITGDDVFFLSSARLSVLDEDSELDVYDARVDGVLAIQEPNPECLGEACQPAPSAPNDPTPASAALQGAGNLKPKAGQPRCPKGKRAVRRKGKTKCVAKKQGHHRKKSKGNAKGRAQA